MLSVSFLSLLKCVNIFMQGPALIESKSLPMEIVCKPGKKSILVTYVALPF